MGIDGAWSGHYVQIHENAQNGQNPSEFDSQYPILARFAVTNGAIAGTMTDIRTERETSIREYIRPYWGRLSWYMKFRWRLAIFNHPQATVRIIWPVESSLEGNVKGDEIIFTKKYLGDMKLVFQYRHTTRTHALPFVPLTYKGRLDSSGATIRGTYEFPPEIGVAGDAFVLDRMPEAPS